MDTIVIAKESLQALNDSIILIFPDSLHTFQSKESGLSSKDWAQILIPILALFISGIGVYIARVNTKNSINEAKEREREKEKIRVEKVKQHVLTWMNILKINLLKQANNFKNFAEIKKFLEYYELKELNFYDFPFSEVLQIERVDLSEFFLNKSKSDSFKLNSLYEIKNRVLNLETTKEKFQKLLLGLRTLVDKHYETIAKINSYRNDNFVFSKGTDGEEFIEALGIIMTNGLKYLEDDFNGFDLVCSQLQKLNKDLEGKEIDKGAYALAESIFNNLLDIKAKLFDLRKFCLESEAEYKKEAAKLDLIEQYYRDIILEDEFNVEYKKIILNGVSHLKQYDYLVVEGILSGEKEKIVEDLTNVRNKVMKSDFLINESITIVDIRDDLGKKAEVTQISNLVCNRDSANRCFFRFSPGEVLSNFTVLPKGSRIELGPNLQAKDLNVILNRSYKKGERLDIQINFDCNDAFTSENEYWIHKRHFEGKSSVKIIVMFQSRLPVSYGAYYFYNFDITNRKLINKAPELRIQGSRTVLSLEVSEIPTDHNIILEWTW